MGDAGSFLEEWPLLEWLAAEESELEWCLVLLGGKVDGSLCGFLAHWPWFFGACVAIGAGHLAVVC